MQRAQSTFWKPHFVEYGGELWRGNAKTTRPMVTKRAIHFVIKSTMAKGEWSFLTKRNTSYIKQLLQTLPTKYGVTIYQQSINGNHIHLLFRIHSRDLYKSFVSRLTGRLTQFITGCRKGKPLGKRFFDNVPFSRIVEWGQDYVGAKAYVLQNELEATGEIPYTPRKAP